MELFNKYSLLRSRTKGQKKKGADLKISASLWKLMTE